VLDTRSVGFLRVKESGGPVNPPDGGWRSARQAAAGGDQLAEPVHVCLPRLQPIPHRLGAGELGEQLQPTTVALGIETLQRQGHAPRVPTRAAFVKAGRGPEQPVYKQFS
jgi:hypothetical protein